MKRKILVIGPKSTHVDRFIQMVIGGFDDVVFIGEEHLDTDSPIRQYIVNFRSANIFAQFRSYRKMRRIVKAENPDVVHVQQVNRVAFLASRITRRLKLKLVVTAWGSDVLLIPKKNFIYKWITRYVLRHANHITADSNEMVEAVKQLAPNTNTSLVMLGIEVIGNSPKDKIVYSNRALYPIYGLEKVIAEFSGFCTTHPDWQLVMAGTGSGEHSLKEQVKKLGIENQVRFVGWLTAAENKEYYQKAFAYISLPVSDGTSVSLLEAMSAGCVPVVSDLPVSHEWIQDLKNGVIKKDGVNALEQAVSLDQIQVAELNAEIISKRGTSSISRRRFSEIYESL